MMVKTFILLALISSSGCHTTERWFSSDLKDESVSSSAKIDVEDIEELKPKILSLQLQYGIFSPSKSMYSMTHIVHCYHDGALRACYLRLILPYAPYLSEMVQLSRDLTEKVFILSFQDRSDLKSERQIFANLICDHMNSSLPPFDKSTIFCRLFEARKINEHVVSEALSNQLTQILVQRSQDASQIPKMKILCDAEKTFNCSLSSIATVEPSKAEAKTVVETSLVLPDSIGGTLSKEMSQSYLQKWSVQSGKNKAEIPNITQIEGTLNCSSLAVMVAARKRCLIKF